MNNKILHLPIETIARELDGKLLLAHRALDRGYRVLIGKKSAVKKTAGKIGCGAFLYINHIPPLIPKSKNNNLLMLALDEEGLVYWNDQVYIERAQPNKLQHLDMVFTWGETQRKLIIEENPLLEQKTKIVGNPRFDLLREELDAYYKDVREDLYNKWGDYVLINTNFTAGNFNRYYGRSYIEHESKRKQKIANRNLSSDEYFYLQERVIYYKKLFTQYVNMIEAVTRKFPELNFIIRPHPSEDHDNWKDALKNIGNAFVVFEGSAVEWIQGAKAVIHTGCTTGIEAWACKKPVIAYNPEPDYNFQALFLDELGVCISNEKDLINAVKNINKSNSNLIANSEYQKQIENIRQRIANISGKLAADRILDSLDESYNTSIDNDIEGKKNAEMDLEMLRAKGNDLNKGLLKVAKKNVSVPRNALKNKKAEDKTVKTASKQKFPGLKKRDITNRLVNLDEIFYNNKRHYKITKVAKKTFLITAKY